MNTSESGLPTMDVYKFIVEYAKKYQGNTPSQRQVATAIGIGQARAHYHIQLLIRQGFLERKDGELCVIRATFAIWPNVYEIGSERIYPKIMEMGVIPKDIRGITPELLGQEGVIIGPAVDDAFLMAEYPPDWFYEAVVLPGDECYMLSNGKDDNRAILKYNREQYAPFLYFF